MKLFDEIPYLENEYLILKRMCPQDAAVVEKMCADERVRRYLPTALFEYGFEDKKKQ